MTRDVLEQRTGGWADGSWSARPWAGGSVVDGSWLGGLSEVDNSTGRLIELGELTPDLDPAASGRGRSRFSRGRMVVALALAAVLVLGGSSTSTVRHPSLLWTVQLAESGHLAVDGDTVYIAPPGSSPTVSAIDLRTGRIRWWVGVPWTPQRFVGLGPGLDAVVVQTTTVDPTDPARDEQTLFVRRTDGRVAAEANGEPVSQVGRLVLQVGSVRRCPLDASVECAAVSAVDPTTGVAAWQLTLPPNARVLAGGLGRDATFVTATADGSLTLRSATTGQPLATVAGTLTGGGGIRLSTYVGGVLVVGVAGTDQSTFTGYRGGSLDRLWSIRLPRDSGPRQVDISLVDLRACGGLVCVGDGGGTAVLDAQTGAVRFRTALQVLAQVPGGPLLAVPYLGHLDPDGRYVSDVDALDALTGRVLTTVVNATLVDGAGLGGSIALVRRTGPQSTTFAGIRRDGTGVIRLTVPGTGLSCAQGGDTLVCLDPDAQLLRAWDIGVD